MSVESFTQFAGWLKKNHPAPFNQLLKASVAAKQSSLGDLDDLGDDTDTDIDVPDVTVPDITIDLDLPQLGTGDLTGEPDFFTSTGNSGAPSSTEISALTSGAGNIALTAPTASLSPSTPDTQSVGDFIASAQSGQVIQAIASGANKIVTSQAAAATISAQAARAAAGLAPANISYTTVTNPATGEVTAVPVLNSATGSTPLNAAGIASLIPPSFLQSNGIWIMLGLAALLYLLG